MRIQGRESGYDGAARLEEKRTSSEVDEHSEGGHAEGVCVTEEMLAQLCENSSDAWRIDDVLPPGGARPAGQTVHYHLTETRQHFRKRTASIREASGKQGKEGSCAALLHVTSRASSSQRLKNCCSYCVSVASRGSCWITLTSSPQFNEEAGVTQTQVIA